MKAEENKLELIGKRISYLKTGDTTSFVIKPSDANWKIYLLFAWLFLWTLSGIVVFANYFMLDNTNLKLVLIMWLGFWAYFEFKIGKAFLFRRFGKEKIWIKGGKLFYWRDIAGKGKKLEFDRELINDFELIVKNKKDFFASMNESFWVIGGECIAFNYASKPYRLGIQLSEEDARELLRQMKFALRG